MEQIKNIILKVIYGSLFIIILPLILIFWAKKTEHFITIEVPNYPTIAWFLLIFGGLLILSSMFLLWKKGNGLPMNAFPPKHFVTIGFYKLFHHPIYVGAVFISFGFSILFDSSSGFWLVSPLFLLMIICYVLGFENEIISKSFPNEKLKTFFDLPNSDLNPILLKNRLLLFVWVYLFWFIIYELFIFIDIPKDAINTLTKIDDIIPYQSFWVLFYVLSYPFAILIPFVLKNNKTALEFCYDMILGMILIFSFYLFFPFIVTYDDINSETIFDSLVKLGRKYDGSSAALPSFHVFWAFISYKYFSLRFQKFKFLFLSLAIAISLSCLFTKNHSFFDVFFGVIFYTIVSKRLVLYDKVLLFSEKISNSWKEWNYGNIRIINHGFYAGLAGFFGFIVMGIFLDNAFWILYVLGIMGFVGAALWAQVIEGSLILLRPFGYYGSVIGIILTSIMLHFSTSFSFDLLIGISALAAPIIQFFGRFRCLVQGCCHGKLATDVKGIKFCHEKSRVTKIAAWKCKNLYPTQLYSIISNLFIFFLLLRLVSLEMSSLFIAGIYLILNGLSRFVEEFYRGEPQTPYFLSMRVYQWIAIISIFLGILLTTIDSTVLKVNNLSFSLIINAFIYGLIITIVYGIDFPNSQKRFSRLTQD